MIEIDWVEIPKDSFLIGISDEQRAHIHDHLHSEFGIEDLDKKTRKLVDRLLRKELQTPPTDYVSRLFEIRRIAP
jgi:hypothetical protein